MAERLLPVFGAVQRPAAWCLLIGGVVTFFAVLSNLIAAGTGLGNVQTAENEADDDRGMSG